MSYDRTEAVGERSLSNKEGVFKLSKGYAIPVILAISTIVYGAFWSYVSISKFMALNATVFDLGIGAQRGWVILHTHLSLVAYFETLINSGIVYPLSPLTATGNYPAMLIVQAFSISIVSPALYRIARLHGLNKNISLLVSLSFFLYFPVYGIFWFDFHYQVFFFPLFIYGYMFYLEKKYFAAFFLLFLSGLVRYPYSIFPLVFSIIEIWTLYHRRGEGIDYRKLGMILSLLMLMLLWTILGYFLMGLSSSISFTGVPVYGINQQGLFPRLFAIFLFLAPLLFLPLISIRWTIFTLPAFFLILASNNAGYTYHLVLQGQYVAGIVPFTILGFVESLSRILNPKLVNPKMKRMSILLKEKGGILPFMAILFVVLVVANSIFAPFGPLNQQSSDSFNFRTNTTVNPLMYGELNTMVSLIPANDPYVAFQNNLPQVLPRVLPFGTSLLMGGYLGAFANINKTNALSNSWPIHANNGQIEHVPINYAIADAGNQYFYQQPNSMYDLLNLMYTSGQYGILSEGYGLILLKYGYHGPIVNYVSDNRTISSNSFENMSGQTFGSLPIVKINDTSDNFMFYGPGTYLFPGSYNVTFYLKTNNNSVHNNIWLQITSNSGSNFLAFEHINGTWFKNTDQWQKFSLHLKVDNFCGKVEFRGFGIQWNGTLAFNGVKIVQESAYGKST